MVKSMDKDMISVDKIINLLLSYVMEPLGIIYILVIAIT